MPDCARTPDGAPLDAGLYVAGLMSAAEGVAYREHLLGCAACRAAVTELSPLPALVREMAPRAVPSADLRARTFAALPARRASRVRRVLGRRPAAFAGAGGLLVAASVAAALLLAGGTEAPTRPTEAGRLVALVTPDDPAGPTGTARIVAADGGQHVRLRAEGLPPAPAGSFYECWVVGPGDTLEAPNRVSVGTFTTAEEPLELVTAGDPERYAKLGVTLEPDDGDPRRTGPKVLVTAP